MATVALTLALIVGGVVLAAATTADGDSGPLETGDLAVDRTSSTQINSTNGSVDSLSATSQNVTITNDGLSIHAQASARAPEAASISIVLPSRTLRQLLAAGDLTVEAARAPVGRLSASARLVDLTDPQAAPRELFSRQSAVTEDEPLEVMLGLSPAAETLLASSTEVELIVDGVALRGDATVTLCVRA